MRKALLRDFLRRNPFPDGLTDGLFYREKMRAIHRIAPDLLGDGSGPGRILDIGGGRSGLAAMLYPQAQVVTVDIDPLLADQAPADARSIFVCADACRLPFVEGAFDAVSMFDVLEHIGGDLAAAREAMRVTTPGGHVLISTPTAAWRYPYHRFMAPLCPPEEDLMAEWGHVRRGYSAAELQALLGGPPLARASFINGVTAFAHDVAFSRLGRRTRKVLHAAAAPLTILGYLCHRPGMAGAEIAMSWRR
jgi:SAM-dependent methyltransferase